MLLDKVGSSLNEDQLQVNVDKTVIMTFRPNTKNFRFDVSMYLLGKKLKVVSEYKYLGCILTSDLSDVRDISRSMNSFNKSVGYVLRKFKSVDTNVLLSLFHSY